MTLMERPIVDLMIDSPASLRPSHEVRPKLTRLIKLNHTDWMHQLAADGFIETEIKNLENFVASSLNEVELAEQLAAMLGPVADMDDKAEVDRAVHKWLDLINWGTIWQQVVATGFPDAIDAMAYAGSHVRNIADNALWFESARRSVSEEREVNWQIDEVEIREGIALAEAGLTQEAVEWPPYGEEKSGGRT